MVLAANPSAFSLMPYPQSIKQGAGKYPLNDHVLLSFSGMHAERQAFITQKMTYLLAKSNITVIGSSEGFDAFSQVSIKVANPNISTLQIPALKQDESYQLRIDAEGVSIFASTEFGVLHGLATLSQLLLTSFDDQSIVLPYVMISDMPRFPWRGLLLDSARHFLSIDTIKRQLDGMAAAKLNVFHWHLTDDQGWRIESKTYPKLHQVASDGLYYRQEEIKEVVAYASMLGIRVVPEFDVPGHASAIAVAYPELLTTVKPYYMEDKWGVFEPLLDPTKPQVYRFIDSIVGELSALFPDEYIHIGGDEVNPVQWQESANVQLFMKENQLADEYALQTYFNDKVQQVLAKYQRKMMGWDEIYQPNLSQDIVVQSWRGLDSLTEITSAGYQGVLSTGYYIDQAQATSFHYRNDPIGQIADTLITPLASDQIHAWQFSVNRLKGDAVSGQLVLVKRNNYVIHAYVKLHEQYYRKVGTDRHLALNAAEMNLSFDSWLGPIRLELDLADAEQLAGRALVGNTHYPVQGKQLDSFDFSTIKLFPQIDVNNQHNVLGGEATLWTELVTEDNIDLRTWPRLFAIAERLWSAKSKRQEQDMYQRLFIIERYASTIGLKHQQQFESGVRSLVFPNTATEPLFILAEQFEPAHYYTRHHLKYQKGLYHQRAPLKQFADFLPVESVKIKALEHALLTFEKGNKQHLQEIINTLLLWHFNFKTVLEIIKKNPKLSNILQITQDARAINTIALTVAQSCLAGVKLTSKQASIAKSKLRKLHSNVREVTLASGLFAEKLLDVCRK